METKENNVGSEASSLSFSAVVALGVSIYIYRGC